MSGTYLTWLADELRAGGCTVHEYDGWEDRARSSGGFASGRPLAVFWHHTASQTSPSNDAHYMCHQSDNRPVANVLISRDGTVWVLAAGCTNTNGKGRLMDFSRGVVPVDSANSYVLGMEIANSGTGEPYPQAQIDAAFKVSNIVNAKMGNQPTDVSTHQFYAPDRKIDPAMGGHTVQGSWHPSECTNSGSWLLSDLRNECARRGTSTIPPPISPPIPPPIPPPSEEDDMPAYLIKANDGTDYQQAHTFWWDGKQIGHVRTDAQSDVGAFLGVYVVNGGTGKPLDNFSADAIQQMIDSGWAGGPVPLGYNDPSKVDSGVG